MKDYLWFSMWAVTLVGSMIPWAFIYSQTVDQPKIRIVRGLLVFQILMLLLMVFFQIKFYGWV